MKCETCNKTSDNEDDFAYPFAHEPDYCWDCFEKLQCCVYDQKLATV